MEEIVYHTNFKLEDSYWWFIARNRIVYELILDKTGLKSGDKILDIGCGTGGFTKLLAGKFDVAGLDMSETALNYCRKRGLEKLYSGYIEDFPADEFQPKAAVMLDVIEHIEDDKKVVKQVFDLLPKGGYLISTVPAYQWLWSRHDEVHMHFRRYKKKNFTGMLKSAGFSIDYTSHFNTFLFTPAVLKRFTEKITGSKADESPVDEVSPGLNRVFTKIFMSERNILKGISLPFGLSIVCIAKKD